MKLIFYKQPIIFLFCFDFNQSFHFSFLFLICQQPLFLHKLDCEVMQMINQWDFHRPIHVTSYLTHLGLKFSSLHPWKYQVIMVV